MCQPMLRGTLFGLTVFLCAAAHAQQECRTVLRPQDVPLVRQREAKGDYKPAGGVPAGVVYVLPLSIHVIRRTDGSGGLSESRVDQAIADTNDLWTQADIQFCQYGPTRFIDDDAFYLGLTEAEEDVLRTIDDIPNTINVYFVPSLSGCGLGSFTFSPVQGLLVANSCAGTASNPSSLAHELGHYFDLFHTHETALGVECVDGSNCDTAGDLLCDTPADHAVPQLVDVVSASCDYTGDVDGPCVGDAAYAPDPLNVMSYSEKICRTDFTPRQIEKARATLEKFRPELIDFGGCSLDDVCGPFADDCFKAPGPPGCTDVACCAAVCALDDFCCIGFWDDLCAAEAIDLCLSGNECENAIPLSEGTVAGVTLVDNTGLTGDDSSCAAGDDVDEWYKYTASCDGDATASICTEFTEVDIVLSVFDACNGAEIACSDTYPTCPLGGDLNARVTWGATAGETYYLRVSAVAATPTENFNGSLLIDCPGCGSPSGGSCFSSNPTPFCNDELCCEAICNFDAFCCNVQWDNICAGEAAVTCVSECGSPVTGSCFEADGTPYCDRGSCCTAVCAKDPFCCNISWDSICVDEAIELCSEFGGFFLPHIPLGEAILEGIGAVGNVGIAVSNIGSSGEDGLRLVLQGLAEAIGAELQLSALMAYPPGSYLRVSARTTMSDPAGLPHAALAAVNVQQGGVVVFLNLVLGPQTYTIRILSAGEVVHEVHAGTPFVAHVIQDQPPARFGASIGQGELSLHLGWLQAVDFQPTVAGTSILGDAIIVTTENNASPDDTAVGTLTALDLTGSGVGGFTAGGELVQGCPWDCGGDADIGVGIVDFLALLAQWGTSGSSCNLGAGVAGVGIEEFLEILANWGECP